MHPKVHPKRTNKQHLQITLTMTTAYHGPRQVLFLTFATQVLLLELLLRHKAHVTSFMCRVQCSSLSLVSNTTHPRPCHSIVSISWAPPRLPQAHTLVDGIAEVADHILASTKHIDCYTTLGRFNSRLGNSEAHTCQSLCPWLPS